MKKTILSLLVAIGLIGSSSAVEPIIGTWTVTLKSHRYHPSCKETYNTDHTFEIEGPDGKITRGTWSYSNGALTKSDYPEDKQYVHVKTHDSLLLDDGIEGGLAFFYERLK